MKAPFFLFYGPEVSVFRTKRALEAEIESPDLDAYEVFDSAGELLRVRVVPRDFSGGVPDWVVRVDPVVLEDGEISEETRSSLASRLRDALKVRGIDGAELSLRELVSVILSTLMYQD